MAYNEEGRAKQRDITGFRLSFDLPQSRRDRLNDWEEYVDRFSSDEPGADRSYIIRT